MFPPFSVLYIVILVSERCNKLFIPYFISKFAAIFSVIISVFQIAKDSLREPFVTVGIRMQAVVLNVVEIEFSIDR